MKIITITSPDYDCPEEDGHLTTTIETNDGSKSASFGHGEPEDMYLFRDLNDAYDIAPMLKMAYEAGKRGEELIEESIKEEE